MTGEFAIVIAVRHFMMFSVTETVTLTLTATTDSLCRVRTMPRKYSQMFRRIPIPEHHTETAALPVYISLTKIITHFIFLYYAEAHLIK